MKYVTVVTDETKKKICHLTKESQKWHVARETTAGNLLGRDKSNDKYYHFLSAPVKCALRKNPLTTR